MPDHRCGCGRTISANKTACRACAEAKPTGGIDILNVGAGDLKVTFNQHNTAEVERAKSMITDMIRRGFAIVVELPDGTYQRVHEFDEQRGVYIIAESVPIEVQPAEQKAEEAAATPAPRKRGRPRKVEMPMATTRATAIGRSAGG